MRIDALQRDNLTDAAIAEIKQMILRGDVRPGDWLPPQPEIASRLGVGLSTVREAVKGLTLVGILQPQPGRGTLVNTDALRLLQILDMFGARAQETGIPWAHEARRIIERELSSLAARRADEIEVQRMASALDDAARAIAERDDALYAHSDLEFHLALGRAAKNQLLDQFNHLTWGMLGEFVRQAMQIPGFQERSLQLHRQLLAALRAHDPYAAAKTSEELVAYGDEIVRASVIMPRHNGGAGSATLRDASQSEEQEYASSAPLYVALTMSCERLLSESPTGGPASWEISERSIRGFCERLLLQGYRPTLFLVPEAAQQHARLLHELALQDVELGLLVDPQSLYDYRYSRPLGDYDAVRQTQIIGLALQLYEQALGQRPRSFRSGFYSANDETYSVLYDLGFRQSSTSDPGRYTPPFGADWRGAEPDPHLVHPRDRLRAGDLPLLEVPLTTDADHLRPNGFPYELRLESGPFAAWQQPILVKKIERLALAPVALPTLCTLTHNHFPYEQEDYECTVTLQALLDYLSRLPYTIVPVTLKEAHERFRAVQPLAQVAAINRPEE